MKQIIWLDWLSSRGERKEKQCKDCMFAGLSDDISESLRKAYQITENKGKYCVIKTA